MAALTVRLTAVKMVEMSVDCWAEWLAVETAGQWAGQWVARLVVN